MVSLRRHGGSDEARTSLFASDARNERAGRAFAALRAVASMVFAGLRVSIPGSDPEMAPAVRNHSGLPRQRGRSHGHKPPNGALRGVTFYFPYEAAFSAPSDFENRGSPREESVWVFRWSFQPQQAPLFPLAGKMSAELTDGGGATNPTVENAEPPRLSPMATSSPQGGRREHAARLPSLKNHQNSHARHSLEEARNPPYTPRQPDHISANGRLLAIHQP
jgi:hypothetical protein